MSKILVTITPPTPNGGLHLGHLAGPFLSADVFARAQRQRGHDAVLLSYSDDYQSYLARKAHELGETEEAVCARFADDIAQTLEHANIAVGHFMRARRNPTFIRVVSDHFALLRARGAITREPRRVPYCEQCGRYGYEAYARGRCDVCGEPSDASQCESCASAPDVERMADLRCTACKQPTAWREVERQVLDLGRYRQTLARCHGVIPKRPQLAAFLHDVLGTGDLRWPISRPHEHGIPVTVDGRDEILHTWFSGLAGYRASFEEYALRVGRPEALTAFWESPDATFAHFLGFDCSFSHAVVYRAILSELPAAPRRAYYYTNAFLKLDNADFSTSRGHAIWARDILRTVSPDVLRFYLARIAPEETTRNFSTADFAQWRPLCERNIAVLQQHADRVRDRHVYADDVASLAALKARWRVGAAMDGFSMRALASVAEDAMAVVLRRIDVGGRGVSVALAAFAALATPIMPALSARLFAGLGIDRSKLDFWLADEHMTLGNAWSPARRAPSGAMQ